MRGGNGIDRFGIPPTAKVEIKIDQNRAKDRDYLDRAGLSGEATCVGNCIEDHDNVEGCSAALQRADDQIVRPYNRE